MRSTKTHLGLETTVLCRDALPFVPLRECCKNLVVLRYFNILHDGFGRGGYCEVGNTVMLFERCSEEGRRSQ
jgi:hypothetical protein